MQDFLAHNPGLVVAGVVFLGALAQWLSHRLRLPSILLLLTFGFAVSPAGLDIFRPERLIADQELMFALVGLAVAVILFEGGLTLRIHEARAIARPLYALIVFGSLIAWLTLTLAARYILGLDLQIALLVGAILIVTGPTVIGPLLRHIRPTGRVASLVKWEGILNDPVGATIAVLVFQAIVLGKSSAAGIGFVIKGVAATLVIGVAFGIVGGLVLVLALRRRLIPDYLEGVAALALALAFFAVSNLVAHESGLLAVTLMGVMVANQKGLRVRPIIEFKEHLGVLLISTLFIILSARLTPEKLAVMDLRGAAFVLFAVLVARPLSVFGALWGSGLSIKEKAFVSWLAPRGIVAAAVASLFALKLAGQGVPGAEKLEPIIFMIILGTVAIYGLTAAPLARRLGLAEKDPQGVLFMGAHPWARSIAAAVRRAGFRVLLVDTNRRNVRQGLLEELPCKSGNLLVEDFVENLDLSGIGRFAALTSNDEANALAAVACQELFGRDECYQIQVEDAEKVPGAGLPATHLHGRRLFGEEASFSRLAGMFEAGAELKVTRLSDEFGYQDFLDHYGERARPLFIVRGERKLEPVALQEEWSPPGDGDAVIALVLEADGAAEADEGSGGGGEAPAP